jgi:hypothetical protein
MAIQIEANISLFKGEHLFTPKIKVDDPKDTPDTLSLERLVSLEIFVSKFQERREQFIDQQEVEERDPNEGFQFHKEEQEFTYDSTEDNEDLVEERDPGYIKHDDKVLMCAPLFDEAIRDPIPPTQKKRMILVTFLFRFLMILYYLIQTVKKKGNPWTS